MDYEKMWNELKEILFDDEDYPAVAKALETMSKLNTKYTTIYIKALQSTRP